MRRGVGRAVPNLTTIWTQYGLDTEMERKSGNGAERLVGKFFANFVGRIVLYWGWTVSGWVGVAECGEIHHFPHTVYTRTRGWLYTLTRIGFSVGTVAAHCATFMCFLTVGANEKSHNVVPSAVRPLSK